MVILQPGDQRSVLRSRMLRCRLSQMMPRGDGALHAAVLAEKEVYKCRPFRKQSYPTSGHGSRYTLSPARCGAKRDHT